MNQRELSEFFGWCEENIKNFRVEDCDESRHFYIRDVRIGGWAGDSRQYFFEHSNIAAKAIRMMDASKGFDKEAGSDDDYSY